MSSGMVLAGWSTVAELFETVASAARSVSRKYWGSGIFAKGLPAFAVLGGALASYWRRKEPPRVSRLFIHPVKGGGPLEVPSARLDELGFANDRRWAVLDMTKPPAARIVLLQIDPRIALLRPELDDHLSPAASLTLRAAGMPDLRVPSPGAEAECVEVDLHNISGVALDCGPEAARWLERFFEQVDLRLAYLSHGPGSQPRAPCKEPYWSGGVEADSVYFPGSRVAFADNGQGTLLSAASLDDLNRRVPRGYKPATVQQMRMNVILSGTRPYEEETWKSFCIARVEFLSSRICSRCLAPNVDPDTGERLPAAGQPLRVLSRYRGVEHCWRMDPRHRGPALGMKFGGAASSGIINVGDPVTHVVLRGRDDRKY